MTKEKARKILLPIGTLCIAFALAIKALSSGSHQSKPLEFFCGLGLGFGVTVIMATLTKPLRKQMGK